MAKYKISKSLNGDQIFWIARFKKTVVSRAKTEKGLLKLLSERDEEIKKRKEASTKKKVIKKKPLSKRLKAAKDALNETEEEVEVKKPTPKKQTLRTTKIPAKKSKKGFWK